MDKITFPFYYRTFAKIDLAAIESNFDELRRCTNDDALACCVVKADAYGHGALKVAKRLEGKTDYFAVATLEEGVELRRGGIQKPIMILGYNHPSLFSVQIENNLDAVIYNLADAEILSETAKKLGKRAKIHIAVDTGMGRIGFIPNESSADIAKKIAELGGLNVVGLFSHFAKADYADKTSANKQLELFENFIAMLERRNVVIPIKHICNSAGAIELNRQFDMVRYGVSLYGMYPSEEVDKARLTLKPAMSVFSHVVHVKTVPPGTPIGYGQIYIAPGERTIATVAIGYADGFNRCLTGKGWVLIGGKKAPIVGKVCMDQIMVDVSGIDDVRPGDVAVILGRYGDEEISAELFGELCHSFNYEVTCTFLPRVKRFYCE